MSLTHRPFIKEPAASPEQEESFFCRLVRTVWHVLWLLFCAALTACLFKLSYPKFSYSLLAWVALAPFVWALFSLRSFWGTVFYSWLSGTVLYAALYHWVLITCWKGGDLTVGLSLAAWLGLSALMAVQFVIFAGSCYYLKKLNGFFPLVGAIAWVALEWGHEMLATYVLGFPWFTLAYSQWNIPSVLQVVSVTGAAGLSFLVAWVGLSIGYAFVIDSLFKSIRQMLLAACIFLLAYSGGHWYLKNQQPQNLLRLRAAVMQPNIDQYKKWDARFEAEIHDVIDQMTAQLEGQDIMLSVWPESVTPGPVQDEPYAAWFKTVAEKMNAWQLVGTNRQENGRDYVSAFLLNPQGQTAGIYDKVHLVPFGETIPFEKTVRRLFPDVAVLGELGAFSAGKWKQPLLQVDQVLLGSTICYESVFSHLWKEQARGGARFFVNITNDAWFFDTDAPYQHLAVSVIRAAEMRRPLLRAANTGISAIISSTGEILSRAELNTRAILQAEIVLPLAPDVSFYAHWGEWFAWLCALLYITILISTIVFICE